MFDTWAGKKLNRYDLYGGSKGATTCDKVAIHAILFFHLWWYASFVSGTDSSFRSITKGKLLDTGKLVCHRTSPGVPFCIQMRYGSHGTDAWHGNSYFYLMQRIPCHSVKTRLATSGYRSRCKDLKGAWWALRTKEQHCSRIDSWWSFCQSLVRINSNY